jgi:inorganic pyrophosphatase
MEVDLMQAYSFDHIPPFCHDIEEDAVNVIVETPRGTRNKFAYKEKYGVIELRRILRGGMVWPCDFGFIPQTHADDGDAIDVALLIDEPCFPGCLVRARIVGSIGLVKNGDENDRLIGVPVSLEGAAATWDEVRSLDDVSPRLVRELEGFLKDYQTFEGNEIELTGIKNREEALQSVRDAAKRWKEKGDA